MSESNSVDAASMHPIVPRPFVAEILNKLRCEYADAVVSRDELERNGTSHGASWWDGVLKGLNIAKRVIEESKDGKHTD